MPKIEIYTSFLCGYCARAKALLQKKNLDYEEIDVMMDGAKRAEMTQRAKGRTSVPQIFVDGAHIGGSDELYALERDGRLDALLQPAP
jgi:glutaredoxin 3